MSGPVVAIGYILLIPSVLGMVISAIGLLGSGGATTATIDQLKTEIRTTLSGKDIPEPIINKVVNLDSVSDADLDGLTDEQKQEVTDARLSLSAGTAGAGLGGAILGGGSVCFGVFCFIGGLLGWLLIMKKKVLQCSSCSAVVAAS